MTVYETVNHPIDILTNRLLIPGSKEYVPINLFSDIVNYPWLINQWTIDDRCKGPSYTLSMLEIQL